MTRIKLTIAYDGSHYCGWQVQPNGITVEEVLNKTITKVTGKETLVLGASRTDSGVHALGNVAVFDTDSKIPPERICHAINQKLPEDIYITKSEEVAADFHPRYQPTRKTYEYHIINTRIPLPTDRLYHYMVSFPLDVDRMKEGAKYLLGTHDFASFCNVRTDVKDTVRTIYQLEVIRDEMKEGHIIIRVEGNGFLYNMVRIIVGTLIRVGRGFYEPSMIKEILEAKIRTEAGVTAPPQGLFLVDIQYKQGEDYE